MSGLNLRSTGTNLKFFMRPVLFYTDRHVFPLPEGHRFPVRKYRVLREILERDGSFDLRPAPLADPATIELAHDPQYVSEFISGALAPAAMRRIGFPWSPELVQRTLASVGGTVAAAQVALQHGISGTLAGGTHHAFRAEGSGYCVFNDIAVAIEWLKRNQSLKQLESAQGNGPGWSSPLYPKPDNPAALAAGLRFAVIDLDVHQGDGTAQIFENDPAVFTFSMHGGRNFPFRKQRSTLDIELSDGAGGEEYLAQLQQALPCILDFRPDMVFYQSGVDPLDSDRLGRLRVSMDGLRRRDEIVFEMARSANLPIVITLGGGYSDPIERTAEAHAQTFRTALHILAERRPAASST